MAITAKTKLNVVLVAGGLLALLVGLIVYQTMSGPKSREVKVDPAVLASADQSGRAPAVPAKPEGEWLPKFREVYSLADGQALKRIPKPFIPERLEFYRARMHPSQVQAIPAGPDFYLLDYNGKDFKMRTAWFGQPDVRGLFGAVLGIESTKLIGPDAVLNKSLPGDVVLRTGSGLEQNRDAFMEMLSSGLHRNFKLEQQDLDRDVIVVSGKLTYRASTTAATAPAAPEPTTAQAPRRRLGLPSGPHLVIYLGKAKGNGWTMQGPDQLMRQLEQLCRMPLVIEGDIGGGNTAWEMDQSAYALYNGRQGGAANVTLVDQLLNNIANQSELQFKREQRSVKTWVLTDEGSATSAPATSPTNLPAAGATLR